MSPARKKASKSSPKAVVRKKTAAPKRSSTLKKKTVARKTPATVKSKTQKPAAQKPRVAPSTPPPPAAVVIGRPQQLEHGTQPLDELLARYGLSNAHLVNASTEQITFKMVHKARRGRHLTPKIKTKILNALHNCLPDETFAHRQLFNY